MATKAAALQLRRLLQPRRLLQLRRRLGFGRVLQGLLVGKAVRELVHFIDKHMQPATGVRMQCG